MEDLIGTKTAGVLHIPADYMTPRQGLLALWRRHLVTNAAMRNREYMKALFASHFPNGTLVETEAGAVPGDVLGRVDNIVLLYPDSIGMDYGDIERQVAARWPSKRVLALNGRRRFFRLDAHMLRRLRLRRFLEACRVPEIILAAALIVAAPVLAVAYLIRGER